VRKLKLKHTPRHVLVRRGHTPVNANLQGPHSPRSPCLAVSQEPPAQCKAAHSTSRALRGALRQCVGKLKSAMNYLDRAGGDMNRSGSPLGMLAAMAVIPGGATDGILGAVAACLHNQTFMTAYWAWLFAQTLKVPTHFLRTGKWRLQAMVDAGGMPSSHSALCMGLTTAVAMQHGLSSSMFPVSLGFSLIVMYDAAGVRRHAGKQAEVINKIVADCLMDHEAWKSLDFQKPLKEVLGHTPLQVIAGAVLGVVVGVAYAHYFGTRL